MAELLAANANGVRFSVIDEGEGIPIAHQERVFERFFQVDGSRARQPKRRGTGLGLAIVKHAARRLGGEVRVHSVYQEGTRDDGRDSRLPSAAVRGRGILTGRSV